MKVGLAELDKKLMLNKEGKLFSRNLSKKYPEKILGADGEFPKISGKRFEGRTDSSENILEGI